MGFFFHNDDPLLSSRLKDSIPQYLSEPSQTSDTYNQIYRQQILNEIQQNHVKQRDWMTELDEAMRDLDDETVKQLNENTEFISLNRDVQNQVQAEIMSLVKYRMNANEKIASSVKKQLEIISETKGRIKDAERKSILELNDYMKNYSNLTFDEYKSLKNGEGETQGKSNNKSKKPTTT